MLSFVRKKYHRLRFLRLDFSMMKVFLKMVNFYLVNFGILFINLYRYLLSPLLPRACRYDITCSNYALLVLRKYGFFMGIFKIIKRLCTCHPFFKKYENIS
jgi:putative membrane protein insertion efficiency factor